MYGKEREALMTKCVRTADTFELAHYRRRSTHDKGVDRNTPMHWPLGNASYGGVRVEGRKCRIIQEVCEGWGGVGACERAGG